MGFTLIEDMYDTIEIPAGVNHNLSLVLSVS